MGVYVFNTDYLVEQLRRDAGDEFSSHDFGRDILPRAVREDHVTAFAFTDATGAPAYWRDVGTVDAYWQAHMELLAPEPPFELYDPALADPHSSRAIAARETALLSSGQQGFVANALLAGGVVVRGATVTNSVLAPGRCTSRQEQYSMRRVVALPGVRVGANCKLRRVIIDAGVEIPDGTCIGVQSATPSEPLRDGGRITLVSRNWKPYRWMRTRCGRSPEPLSSGRAAQPLRPHPFPGLS